MNKTLGPKISIILPCLNEEETIGSCIEEIIEMARLNHYDVEIIVADNGSTDRSIAISRGYGVHVENVEIKGYGSAIQAGIAVARAEYVVIGDSDSSYDFRHTPRFIEALENGADLVMGNRFKGTIHKGAMPKLHRYIGNPILSFLARLMFRIPLGDFHCGLRAVRKTAYLKAAPITTGMEFATEMIIRLAQAGVEIIEVPTDLRVDGRTRKPHLRSFPDGWRHLKLMLLYSPKLLQIYPGAFLFALGFGGSLQYIRSGQINLVFASGSLQTGLISLLFLFLGSQLFVSGTLNIEYAKSKGILRFQSPSIFVRLLKSKSALFLSIAIFLFGFIYYVPLLELWKSSGYSYLDPSTSSRRSFGLVLSSLLSFQLLLSSLQIRQFTSRFW
jgi:glycosyltransferase involved in cell wall biosynthesis